MQMPPVNHLSSQPSEASDAVTESLFFQVFFILGTVCPRWTDVTSSQVRLVRQAFITSDMGNMTGPHLWDGDGRESDGSPDLSDTCRIKTNNTVSHCSKKTKKNKGRDSA